MKIRLTELLEFITLVIRIVGAVIEALCWVGKTGGLLLEVGGASVEAVANSGNRCAIVAAAAAATSAMLEEARHGILAIVLKTTGRDGRSVGVRHAAQESGRRAEFVHQLEHGSLIVVVLAPFIITTTTTTTRTTSSRTTIVILLHGWHFRGGERA